MKTYLAILLFVTAINGFAIRDKRQYQMDQGKFINEINTARRQLAKQGNIANMWKWEWSQKLVEKAYEMKVDDCLGMAPGFDYRFFYHGGNKDANDYELGWLKWFMEVLAKDKDDKVAKVEMENQSKRTAFILEKLNPLQSKVGCIPSKCEFDVAMNKDLTYHLKYKYVCLIGPYGQFPRGSHQGAPGSGCGSEGHNEDGLCVEN